MLNYHWLMDANGENGLFIVGLPTKIVIFHSYVGLPELYIWVNYDDLTVLPHWNHG